MAFFPEDASHFSESGCLILETNLYKLYIQKAITMCTHAVQHTQHGKRNMSPTVGHTNFLFYRDIFILHAGPFIYTNFLDIF